MSDLIKITEIFAVASSLLVAALDTADTNPHQAGVSLGGLVVSALWLICSREAFAEVGPSDPKPGGSLRVRVFAWLPLLFVVGWFGSTAIHAWLWRSPAPGS